MAFRSQHFLSFGGRVSWPFYVLLLILVVALGLRLNGINWDQGYGFHPDERDIYMRSGCMYDLLTDAPNALNCGYLQGEPDAQPGLPGIGTLLDAERSPLNPHWFPLGSILIYVMVFFRFVAERFTDLNALDMRYIGRPLSALADVGSVALVFILGRRLYGTGVGLLAAGLTAISVIHIQNSHFYRPETFSVFFTLASFWAMFRMVERKRLRDSALLGLILGLAIAPKVSILPIMAPMLLVYWYRVLDEVDGHWSQITPDLVQRIFSHAALAGVIAAGVFFITAPYALLDAGAFLGDLAAQAGMARNAGLWPFTIQYIDTPAFIYQIQQSSVWGLGIPLGVVAWLSIPFTAVLAALSKENRRADLFLLAWVVPGFIFLETFEVHFLRYVFPLMPVMIIMGARMLLWMVKASRPLPGRFLRRSGPVQFLPGLTEIVVVFVVLSTAFYALAFQQVYAQDHPAVTASEWINANVPRGTDIVSDNHWDEFLPNLYNYDLWQFPVYDPDTPEKMDTLAGKLASSEYVLFYSSRPYASAARAPDRFPFSNQYYQELFAGGLGYDLDRTFTNFPELLGVSFRDDAIGRAGLERPGPLNPERRPSISLNLGYADDNAVGYDHPQVLLFRNADHLTEERIRDRLRVAPQVLDLDPRPAGLLLSGEDLTVQQEGGTFSDIVDRDGWTNGLPVLAWLLVVEIIYLAALPLSMFIFRPLPDRGIILARILGLLAVSYVAWISVSLGWLDYSQLAVYAGLALVAGLSLLTLAFRWGEITGFLKEHWRLLLFGEALFLTAFLGFVLLRHANPDLWHPIHGGEKPMELAYLTAVVRSTTLPPFDPWFAGGYLNYYYWGYFVISGIIRVTGILPTTAFNLAVPMFFALTLTGAYTLVYNLAEGVRQRRAAGHLITWPGIGTLPPLLPVNDERAIWRQWVWSPVGAGVTAGLFTVVIGNFDGLVKVVQNTWHRVVDGVPIPAFDYWLSSRMLPDLENFDPNPLAFWVPDRIPGFQNMSPHITEFPFFTFLFADLHAHMMVIPFTLLVIGLGLNLIVGLRDGSWLWTAVAALALALGLGSLWVVNSWDFPSYVILTVGLLAVAVYLAEGTFIERLALLALLVVGVLAVSILAFLPFHQAYETFNSGVDVSLWRTPVDRFIGIHGLFLFVIGSFLLYQARETLRELFRSVRLRGYVSAVPGMHWLRLVVAVGLLGAVFFAAAGYWTVVLLVVFLILAGIVAWTIFASKDGDRPFAIMPLALLVMALFIGIGVDLVRVEGDIGRMNTLFKFYLEIWVLLSIVAAYMLWHLGTSGFLRTKLGWRSGAWLVILVALIGSSLIYTALGSRSRLSERFTDGPSTLDGTAYMAAAVHQERGQPIELKWDMEAIRWLQDNVEGSPVVLEAHMEFYRWGARFASYTGLPTVLGWPWHQTQQRMAYSSTVQERARDVREMYETTDVGRALELLRQYRVRYVVVGDLERIIYTADGLLKFQNLGQKVFENQGTAIYKARWN